MNKLLFQRCKIVGSIIACNLARPGDSTRGETGATCVRASARRTRAKNIAPRTPRSIPRAGFLVGFCDRSTLKQWQANIDKRFSENSKVIQAVLNKLFLFCSFRFTAYSSLMLIPKSITVSIDRILTVFDFIPSEAFCLILIVSSIEVF